MPGLVKPHGGGALKPLMLTGEALDAARARAATLPKLRVSSREKGDLIMLGIGGFTPLTGFMTRADWEDVCDGYRTASGLFWPIPITLSTDAALADGIQTGAEIALGDPDSGDILATMRVTEKYRIDKAHECMSVFKTTELEHPGVKLVMQQGEVNLAGPVQVLSDGGFKAKYGRLFMTPAHSSAWAGRASPRSRPATRCTARTSTSPRWRSRPATACWCTRCSARSSPATSRPRCVRAPSAC
jgi:sulfate adenylyltransferase